MQQFLEKIIKTVIFSTFFIPLVVLPTSFIFPFIVPKIIAFRIAVSIMVGCYILLLMSNFQKYKPPANFFTVAVGLFFLSFTISTFVGVDPYHSFWDNHERMLGLFTLLHYGLFFMICSLIFKTWSEWKKALTVFLFAGSIVMLLGLWQVFNPYFLLNQGDTRVISTLGNSIYVGGYGLFLFFVAVVLLLKEKNTVWRAAEAGAAVLAVIGIFYSGSRGSLLGFVAGISLTLILYSILLKEQPKARKAIWAGLGALVVVCVLMFAFRSSPFVQGIPGVGRVVNTTWEGLKNSPRFYALEIAVQSWKDRPVFGWGPNNFFYAYNAHYNPRSLEHGYGETWFDNAHNILLNTLSVQGIVGLLTYLGMFAAAAVALTKTYRRGELNREVYIIALAFLTSHLVQNITVFENPTSYLYFMFWLAMIASLTRQKQLEEVTASKPIGNGALASVGFVVFLFVYIFNIQPARANMMTLETLHKVSTDPANNLELLKKSLTLSTPHIDDIRNDITLRGLGVVTNYYQMIGPEKANEILDLFDEALRKNMALHPRDIRVHLTMTQLKNVQVSLKQDGRYFLQAEQYLTEALQYSPRRQQIAYNLATIKLQLGKAEEALSLLEKTRQDNPKIPETYWRKAIVYRVMNQPEKVREQVVELKKLDRLQEEDKQVLADLESYLSSVTTTKK